MVSLLEFSLILTILICGKNAEESNTGPTLTIPQGTLKGRFETDYYGNLFSSFEGIPYAKPPIGKLRFKAPKEADPWNGTLDASRPADICVQREEQGYTIAGSEDCLFVNVYVKQDPSNTVLKPVMFWIHGGAFKVGSPYITRAGLLMAEDVVLVTIQYRLNVFGFLSIDDPSAGVPGNAGLKDQVMALKWVQRNIHHFGGDPGSVTIFGVSAGGASTHLLALSPMATGLFHRFVSQSGTAMCPWVSSPQDFPALADRLNCTSGKEIEMFNCVQEKSANAILDSMWHLIPLEEYRTGELAEFTVVIEKAGAEESFLSEPIEQMIKEGKFAQIPWLVGYTSDEGVILLVLDNVVVKPNFTNTLLLIPADINISSRTAELGNEIKQFYYGSSVPDETHLDEYIKYQSDVTLLEKLIRNARQHAAKSAAPVYLYEFAYTTRLSDQFNRSRPVSVHGEDQHYLFVTPRAIPGLAPDSAEFIAIQRMVKMWTSFAKTGNPNPSEPTPLIAVEWLPFTSNASNYLYIAPELQLRENPLQDRMEFWERLYKKVNPLKSEL